MDRETFARALNSMQGFGGMVGVMGGNPPDHPDFEWIARHYHEHWAKQPASTGGRRPIEDFGAYHASALGNANGKRRGLWSSIGPGYYRHFETIQEVWGDGYQCLNDHNNGAKHQPLLVTRQELGIPDDEWERLRGNCWVQRLWSSSITPKGAFPCEIMAALDWLYDGPGGWPIEPGWWRRTPDQFGDLLRWCELCSAPLAIEPRRATEMIQDVSPAHLELLRSAGSPAIEAGRFQVLDAAGWKPFALERSKDSDWYMPEPDKARRVSTANKSITRKRIEAVTVCVDLGEDLRRTLPGKVKQFDRYVVVTASHDTLTRKVAAECGAEVVVSDACYDNGDAFNKGRLLNEAIKRIDATDWVCFTDPDIFLPPWWRERIDALVLNPGCLYYTARRQLHGDGEPEWPALDQYESGNPSDDHASWGYLQLVNVRAASLAGGLEYPTIFCSAGSVDFWFQARFERGKRVSLADFDQRLSVVHIYHGGIGGRWNGRQAATGWRYSGQSNIESEHLAAKRWPVPCLARRIDMVSAQVHDEIEWWGGDGPVWPTRAEPGAVYEYSIKEPQ